MKGDFIDFEYLFPEENVVKWKMRWRFRGKHLLIASLQDVRKQGI